MKVLDKSSLRPVEDVPVVAAVPLAVKRPENARAGVVPVRPAISNAELTATTFLRQFRVLLGAARLYQRNHPRLMEILASTEQQLRIALAAKMPLIFGVERTGMIFPRQEGNAPELLPDPRGELRALADELSRSGICSLLFTHPINVGELDLLAHGISQVPRSATPGDTASRKLWEKWVKDRGIVGIRLNIPTERRDSLLLASLISAVLAYDDAAKHTPQSRAARILPHASFDNVATSLRLLAKLAPPIDPEMQPSTEELARRFHSVVSGGDAPSIALIVHAVSLVRPREGETLEPYLDRLADMLVLAFARQEFDNGLVTLPELPVLFARLDHERSKAHNSGSSQFGVSQHDENRVSVLCEKFWNTLPARVIARTLRGHHAWCVPPVVVGRFLEPLALAADKKKSEASAREGRVVLMSYARCLDSEEGKARRAVAAGLAEIAPQLERLWPHPNAVDFGRGIVRALLKETSPGIAGLLSAAVENLAHISLVKRQYAEFERILEALEAAPRDDEHAHIATLVARIIGDEQWFYLVDDALDQQPLNPAIPRLLKRCPDRLIDRLGLLLTAANGAHALPAMVRLIHATGEPVLGALECRLYEPRKQRTATAIQLLACSDPKRLAQALPRALVSWEWSLQDLAATELMKWTNPSIVTATAQTFLATLIEAHAMVVPCMIDHLGLANERAAVPILLKIATGEEPALRDIFFRIKAIEALGRMRVAEAGPVLLQIVRQRNGLAHAEPSAIRSAAEEALALLENRQTSGRAHSVSSAHMKPAVTHSRPRRYPRVRLQPPLPATISGTRNGSGHVRVIALGGALLETDMRLMVGDSMQLEFRSGMRRIQSTAVVRTVMANGAGVEFVHMKARDRELLRRLVLQLYK